MMFKRRRIKKTDYRQRLALLKSGKLRLAVRRALNNIHVQIIRCERSGDIIITEIASKELRRYGWLAHCGNLPSAYLTGLLAGLKAKKAGVNEAVLDIGLQASVKGNSLYAAVLGIKDAGLEVPVSKDALPDIARVSGKNIADFATILKKESHDKYRKQFSFYIKNNFDPEKLPEHFEEIRDKILKEYGLENKVKKLVTAGGSSASNDKEWEDAE